MKLRLLLPAVLLLVAFLSCSRDEPTLVQPPPPAPVTAKINEAYSRGTIANPDWIEIYNPSTTETMNLAGYKVYDAGGRDGSKPKKEFPAGTTISPAGFVVIVVDDTTASGFGISSSGETVYFENAAGTILDSIAIPALGVDTSYARQPNGAANWQKITPPTRGVSNGTGGVILPVVMNEIYSRGIPTAPDWIEIYNPSSVPVELTGYKIYDVGGQSGTKPKKRFPDGTTVPALGFYVIVTDTPDSSGFGLSSTGETVWLENAGGTVIDNVMFPSMSEIQTYGRYPDGSATLQLLNTMTRGTPNRP